jgi:hypothetical protein
MNATFEEILTPKQSEKSIKAKHKYMGCVKIEKNRSGGLP